MKEGKEVDSVSFPARRMPWRFLWERRGQRGGYELEVHTDDRGGVSGVLWRQRCGGRWRPGPC